MESHFEKTFAMIKPDAVKAGKAEEICQLIEVHGFVIIVKSKLQLTLHRAQDFYGEHKGKPFFDTLMEFMTSGPIYALVLAKPDGTKNATHGSDMPKNAAREIHFFFPQLHQVLRQVLIKKEALANDVGPFMERALNPVLVQALTVLAKEKPCAQPVEALTFLGQWLLDNNPSKPRVILPAGT